ncbi:MAG TPA: ABC transporter substrate-binding protein [Candidatus Acidoferrales bacterium]|nr:ABC transporter substrate-binding protein [Candidatus Acidoferrales bacterium]
MNSQEQIFAAQRSRLFGIAYRMLGSRADAEDALQDAYIRWHRSTAIPSMNNFDADKRRLLSNRVLTTFSPRIMLCMRLGLGAYFPLTPRCFGMRAMRITARRLVMAALVMVALGAATGALAAPAKLLTKLVIGYGSTDGTIGVLGFAKETKLFEKHGLDVVLVGMGTGSVSLRALIAKELEIASLSGSGLVQAALQGADTVLIAALINGFVFKIFSIPEISTPTQLKGKKLGVSRYGATSDFAVRLALKKWGLNPDREVNILQIGTSQDTVRAMQTKMIDAGIMSGASSLIARKSGFRELLDLDLGLDYPSSAVGTTKSYLQKNEAVVKEFMLAYIEAIHDFKRNRETALAVLKKYTRNDDREVLEDAYNNAAIKYLAFPIPTIEGIRTILTELSGTMPAAKNADPEQFVSTKIAREIEASGFVKRLYEK